MYVLGYENVRILIMNIFKSTNEDDSCFASQLREILYTFSVLLEVWKKTFLCDSSHALVQQEPECAPESARCVSSLSGRGAEPGPLVLLLM